MLCKAWKMPSSPRERLAQLPVFVREPKDQSLDIGEEFKFEAEVHGYPTLEITCACRKMTSKQKVFCVLRLTMTESVITVQQAFRIKFSCQPPNDNNILRLKDNKPIETNSHLKTSKDGDIYKLVGTIKGVEDAGIFTCKAANKAGEDSRKATLKISGKQCFLFGIIKYHSGVEATRRHLFHRYTKPSKPTEKVSVESEISVKFVQPRQGDLLKLSIGEKQLSRVSLMIRRDGNYLERGSKYFAPKITEKLPSSIDLTEGEPLNLKAKISGKPVPEIKWVKDGKPLRPSNRIKMSVSPDGTAELSIADMTHDDAGIYKVVATNDKGQTASEANVGVAFRPKTTKPFVGQLHAIDAVVGKPIVFEAKVTGNPQPKIEWFKNDAKLESSPHVKLSEEENKAILIIEAAKLDDAGEYKLTASNDQGEDSSSATVKVSDNLVALHFKYDFCHMTATAGSDVVQSGRPIFDDFFQHLWPYIGNNTANVVFQIVKRLWLIRIDQ
ncbi:obscurin [Trichonephila clavipes]|nr:obscurin [Trichonephila clavipes]